MSISFTHYVCFRNSLIPVTGSEQFSVAEESAGSTLITDINVAIYQGEHKQSKHNHYIGSYTLKGVANDQSKVKVILKIDVDGLLQVSGKSVGNHEGQNFVVKNTDVKRRTNEDLEKMAENVKNLVERARRTSERIQARDWLEKCTYYFLGKPNDVIKSLTLKGKEKFRVFAKEILLWVEENQDASLVFYSKKRKEFIDRMNQFTGGSDKLLSTIKIACGI